jgi:hypothetical protein
VPFMETEKLLEAASRVPLLPFVDWEVLIQEMTVSARTVLKGRGTHPSPRDRVRIAFNEMDEGGVGWHALGFLHSVPHHDELFAELCGG